VRDSSVLMPGIVDRHVHLGLVDAESLRGTSVVEVHDLGWSEAPALRWRRGGVGGVAVRVAGRFLSPVGGYPKGRPWAPDDAVLEIADVLAAEEAVAAVADRVDVVKITLHAGFPRFADGVLPALVGGAHAAGLDVVAHVEGPGQAALAFVAGVDVLAHVPWTERLDDELVAGMAARCTWISTLAIHDGAARGIAIDNARRFVETGGRLRYGTDLGNGDGPVGLRRDEVLAIGRTGLSGPALLEVLTGHGGGPIAPGRAVSGEGQVPEDPAGMADWYLAARPAMVTP